MIKKLKPGSKVVVTPAGTNLKVTGEGVLGSIVKVAPNGNVRALTVKLDRAAQGFEVAGVARLRLRMCPDIHFDKVSVIFYDP